MIDISTVNIVNRNKLAGGGPIPTFEDDFANDAGWTLGATASISGGKFNYNSNRPGVFSWKALGFTASETAWVMRFVSDLTTFNSGNPNVKEAVILSDSTQTEGLGMDGIGLGLTASTSSEYYECSYNGSTSNLGGLGIEPLTGPELRYLEVVRQSATLGDFRVWINDDFTNLEAEITGGDVTSITGLDNLWIGERDDAATEVGELQGTFDTVQVFDGVTSP